MVNGKEVLKKQKDCWTINETYITHWWLVINFLFFVCYGRTYLDFQHFGDDSIQIVGVTVRDFTILSQAYFTVEFKLITGSEGGYSI